ncbi:hypothetical protein CTAYLR_004295 [Chrysophaeum taylorii]|uniref:Ubiquitin-like domain-containing protein n=1 Tax=Chrysophaeum taylorii TaxID=2483200 RepID=A0AAD7UEJ9_9STRA|nr:hypothetical protein CTAYLR_004295 [Chrysophaeum taylorii]
MESKTVRILSVSGAAKEVSVVGSRVSSLMEAVEEAFGVAPARQRLICSGRIMRPDDLLSAYALNGTIHLFPRTEPAVPLRRRESPPEDYLLESGAAGGGGGVFALEEVDIGSPREFLWGFVMGFVLGFIMLLYLWERSVSYRQKMGILAGATAQLFVKYVHSGWIAAQAQPPPGD